MADNFKKEYAGSMDSKYYFSAEKIPAGKVGATASPQTPNQIGELTSRLNQGLKAVEIGAMNQRLLDQVPLEHFNEIRRMNKLTGAEATLHAPIQDLDLAGFSQQGWSEFNRKESVEKLKSSIDRARQMDIKGNIPITVHAGGFPAQKWQKEGLYGSKEIKTEDGRKIKDYTIAEGEKTLPDQRSEMMIVNRETGQMQNTRYEIKEYISGEKQAWTPERRMDNLNRTEWDREKLQIIQWKKEMNEVEDRFRRNEAMLRELELGEKKNLLTEEEQRKLATLKSEEEMVEKHKEEIYTHIRSLTEDMYSRFKKYGAGEKIELEKTEGFKRLFEGIKNKEEEVEEYYEKYRKTKDEEKRGQIGRELTKAQFDQVDAITRVIQNLPPPKTWISADDFAKEKVSNSITEAALYAYGKYGKDAPIISMENVYPEFALSRADSLKETVELAKGNFVDELIKKKDLSKKEAEKIADKIIGVTWDVGHIYMLKKHGYTDEDIRKEAAKIGKHVTHIHLTDNFGFEDSHLPPGEGTVNIKEQLKEIEESLSDEQKGKIKSIVEAGEFVANFKEVPHLYALSNLNSPLYTEDVGPRWDEIWDTHGHYMAGFGEIMPQKYFDLYGAPGFAQLPRELGGSAGSPERGRFASSQGEEQ
ncbi:hypothetical protein HYT56_04315 [Candidatus Woesearchaeota archaeon]|nr:hypothetical protein [Candidatus Woesearchaeota archaeon]